MYGVYLYQCLDCLILLDLIRFIVSIFSKLQDVCSSAFRLVFCALGVSDSFEHFPCAYRFKHSMRNCSEGKYRYAEGDK